jgi:phospho-N-acetylmuramoyl-pentapeptide-transferase
VDDYLNITERSKQKGLSAKVKLWSLILFSVLGALWFTLKLGWSIIHIPGMGDYDLGLWYFPLFVFILVGTSNSVNLTDGLDGLAGGLLAIAFGVFGAISYFYGLPILSILCMIIVGTLCAFLWFNVPPAKIYMGDTGSLALGATLGVIAMLTNAIVILAIVGMVFIVETISVALQLFWKKKFKRKLFKIAPIHHHFEAKGWSETQVTMRFWLIGTAFGVVGLLIGILGMGEGGIL